MLKIRLWCCWWMMIDAEKTKWLLIGYCEIRRGFCLTKIVCDCCLFAVCLWKLLNTTWNTNMDNTIDRFFFLCFLLTESTSERGFGKCGVEERERGNLLIRTNKKMNERKKRLVGRLAGWVCVVSNASFLYFHIIFSLKQTWMARLDSLFRKQQVLYNRILKITDRQPKYVCSQYQLVRGKYTKIQLSSLITCELEAHTIFIMNLNGLSRLSFRQIT